MILEATSWLVPTVLESLQFPEWEQTQFLEMFQCLRKFLFGMAVLKALIFTHLSQARLGEIYPICSSSTQRVCLAKSRIPERSRPSSTKNKTRPAAGVTGLF